MRQATGMLSFDTNGKGLTEVTDAVRGWLEAPAIANGLLTLFIRHSSASLLIQENAAPAARRDLAAYFERIAPEHPRLYEHDDEGPDDMPAHLRSALTQTHLSIPVANSALLLGRWQAIFLFEHRRAAQRRQMAIHLIGE